MGIYGVLIVYYMMHGIIIIYTDYGFIVHVAIERVSANVCHKSREQSREQRRKG